MSKDPNALVNESKIAGRLVIAEGNSNPENTPASSFRSVDDNLDFVEDICDSHHNYN